MTTYNLPVTPTESRHIFTRGGIEYTAVKGLSPSGRSYAYLEKTELVDGILKERLYPTRVYQIFDKGSISKIESYWVRHLVHPISGQTIVAEASETCHTTNEEDLIFFCSFLGTPIIGSMLNGAVRGPVMGFEDQPIVDETGAWRQDIVYQKDPNTGEVLLNEAGDPIVDTEKSYDTTKASDKTAYSKKKNKYAVEEEPTIDESNADTI
jgi:hypothetical protein